jgi:hypothetical protein
LYIPWVPEDFILQWRIPLLILFYASKIEKSLKTVLCVSRDGIHLKWQKKIY